MKIKICLQQNNALDSCKWKALKAVAMSVQPCSARVLCCGLPSTMLWLAGEAQPPESPRERLHWEWTGVVQRGGNRCVSCWYICEWVKSGINCRVKVMAECSGCSVCKAVLYLGTNLYITCLQAVVLGKPLKSLKSIHQFSLPHFWMVDLKSSWLVKCKHSAVSEVLGQLLLREIRSRCLKMHKLWFVF